LNEKKFLLIVAGWFVLSFIIMWLIGGACLNPINGTSCVAQNSFAWLSAVPIIGLVLPFDTWASIMYFVAPICGFIFAFVLIHWWNKNFETQEASGLGFLAIILILLFVGYSVNLFFYMNEAANLNSRGSVKYSLYFCLAETDSAKCSNTVARINQENISIAQSKGVQVVDQLIPINYWGELKKSMFTLFVFGAIAAWIPLFGRRIYAKYRENESA
jgi:hypothetical protein